MLRSRNGMLFGPQFIDRVRRMNPRKYFTSSVRNVGTTGTIITGLVSRSPNAVFRVKCTRTLKVPICNCFRGLAPVSHIGLVVTRTIRLIFTNPSSITGCLRANRRARISCVRFWATLANSLRTKLTTFSCVIVCKGTTIM